MKRLDILWFEAPVFLIVAPTIHVFSPTIPVFLFCFFAFYNAPKLDRYLNAKYGDGYEDYVRRTKMLIPLNTCPSFFAIHSIAA